MNPAWHSSPLLPITARPVFKTASFVERQAVIDDIITVKDAATKRLAPDTGANMNEGDRNDAHYIHNFYGRAYEGHLEAKTISDGALCSAELLPHTEARA